MHLEIFCQALANVTQKFFNLNVTYGNNFIVRERVFCYELYHQIRLLTDGDELMLNGEPDKRFHQDICKEDWRNPDFILHEPGSWSKNKVICEVKGVLNVKDPRGLFKDIETLLIYVERYQYENGILVVFNCNMSTLTEFIMRHRRKISQILERNEMSGAFGNVFLLTASWAHQVEGPVRLLDVLHR